MKKTTTRRMAVIGMTAAAYAALTILLQPISYGEIQCRISEALNLLAFINPIFAPGIILGCFIANLFSPVNPLFDSIFGTLHTATAMLFITKFSKNLFIASLWPTVFCFYISGMILYVSGIPWSLIGFISLTAWIMAGQFIAVTVIGYPLFSRLLRNEKFAAMLKAL